MQDKLGELMRLMDEGYELVSVDSDEACMHATLRRAGRVTVLRLHRADAVKLLSRPLLNVRR